MNWPCGSLFQHSIAEALPKGRSERTFKYKAHREDHEECKDIVTQAGIREKEGSEKQN